MVTYEALFAYTLVINRYYRSDYSDQKEVTRLTTT